MLDWCGLLIDYHQAQGRYLTGSFCDNEREPGDKTLYTVSLYVLDARKVHLGGARLVSWKLQLRIFLVRSVMLSDAKIALRACLKINKNCDSRVHDGMHDIGNFEGEGRSGR